jgi:hypothetical protein
MRGGMIQALHGYISDSKTFTPLYGGESSSDLVTETLESGIHRQRR